MAAGGLSPGYEANRTNCYISQVPPLCFMLRYGKKIMTEREKKQWELENGSNLIRRKKVSDRNLFVGLPERFKLYY